jgi:hypothetical protein
MATWSEVNFSALPSDLRIDAEYFRPDVLKLRRAISEGSWKVKTVEELSESVINFGAYSLCNDIRFQEHEDRDLDAVRFITAQDIQDGFVDFGKARWISAAQHKGLLWKSETLKGQVLVAMAARLGHAAVNDRTEPLNSSQDVAKITVANPDEVDPYYLSVYLNSSIGRNLLLASQTGSVQQHTNLGRIKEIPVVVLPWSQQQLAASKYRDAIQKRQEAASTLNSAETILTESLGLDNLNLNSEKSYSRRFVDLQAENRFDAEYFSPKYQRVIKRLREGGQVLEDVVTLSERIFTPRIQAGSSHFRYIEIGSLTDDGEAEPEELETVNAPSRATWMVTAGDIITSTVRPLRRLSALIRDDQDGCICSSGFAVLRPNQGATGVAPEVLLTYLRLPIICEILNLNTTASMYPSIAVRRLLQLPISLPDRTAQRRIVAKVQKSFDLRLASTNLMNEAKSTVETLIMGNLAQARG